MSCDLFPHRGSLCFPRVVGLFVFLALSSSAAFALVPSSGTLFGPCIVSLSTQNPRAALLPQSKSQLTILRPGCAQRPASLFPLCCVPARLSSPSDASFGFCRFGLYVPHATRTTPGTKKDKQDLKDRRKRREHASAAGKPVLIVCPRTVLPSWETHLAAWGHFDSRSLLRGGSSSGPGSLQVTSTQRYGNRCV